MLNGVEKEHARRLDHARQYVQAIKDNLSISKRPVKLDTDVITIIEEDLKEIRRLLAEKNGESCD